MFQEVIEMGVWNPKANALFLQAIELPAPERRLAFLDEACAGDPALRVEVEQLLKAHDEAGNFLRSPLLGKEPTLDGAPESDKDLPCKDLGLAPDEFTRLGPSLHSPVPKGPRTVIGPYKLLQQIGAGGMGVVYMAEQTEPVGRRVALKIIKPGMDSRQVIARFEAEEQALAMMDHPNIAKVFEAGTTDSGQPYFVMELIKGIPITQYCDQHHLTPRQRLELFVPVCHAVQHAHQKGIIHRDIKPTNVLVAEYDDRPVPKIIDFGVAKATQQQLTERTIFTQLGQVVGTIDYMSPEQAKLNQLDIDTRSDIYSLGVLLYELLTGETPLDRQRLRSAAFDEMLRIIREEQPPQPSHRLSSSQSLPSIAANRQTEPKALSTLVRGELDWIVMKALEKDRERRYETANGVAADIERYLSDEPVLACPPSAAYRFKKFAQRNKATIAAILLIALALILGLVGTSSQAVRATRAERTARHSFEEERHARQEATRERESARQARDRAVRAEREATRHLFGAYLAQAKASRWSGRAGQRLDSLDALAKAAELVPRLGVGNEERMEIRNQAIACTALTDLRVFKQWESLLQPEAGIDFSPDLRSYARPDTEGNIRIRRVTDDQEITRLSCPATSHVVRFSPDGRFLAVISHVTDESSRLGLWELATRKAVLNVAIGRGSRSLDFSPDSRQLAVDMPDGSIRVYDVAAGKECTRLAPTSVTSHICFAPDGRRLGVSSTEGQTVQVWDLEKGSVLQTLSHPTELMGIAWRADGKLLAAGGFDFRVYLWEADSGKLLRVSEGHKAVVHHVAFHPKQNLLVSHAWDGTSRIWWLADGSQLLTVEGTFLRFDPDGRYLAFANGHQIGLWEVASRAMCQTPCASGASQQSVHAVAISSDGRLMASGDDGQGGVRLWDLTTFREVAQLPTGSTLAVRFHPTDGSLVTGSTRGLYKWPIQRRGQQASNQLAIGPPVPLGMPAGSVPYSMDMSPDGSIFVFDDRGGGHAVVLHPALGKTTILGRGSRRAYIATSPDGKWVARGNYQGNGVEVWDGQTGKLLRNLPAEGTATVAFSPDGQWLVTAATEYKFWRTDSWKPHSVIQGIADLGGRMAFTPDGKVLAVKVSRDLVRLVETSTKRVLADLEATPRPARVQGLCFSPDGTQLAVACGTEGLRVWDLRRVRDGLAAMQLDWDLPPYPPAAQVTDPQPLQVEVNLGPLAGAHVKQPFVTDKDANSTPNPEAASRQKEAPSNSKSEE